MGGSFRLGFTNIGNVALEPVNVSKSTCMRQMVANESGGSSLASKGLRSFHNPVNVAVNLGLG